MKKTIEVEVDVADNKEQLDKINEMVEDERILKLLKLGYKFQSPDEAPPIKNLIGVESYENGMTLVDRSMVSLYAQKMKIDNSKVLVTISLAQLKIAFELGMDEVCITQKDHPVFCRHGDSVLVIAPRIKDDC